MNAARRRQQGFLLMAAVFLVVVVGAFIGYLATQSNVQEVTSTDDLQSARALQAARAGLEWGAYTILQNQADAFVTGCQAGTSTKTLDASNGFGGTTLAPFTTTLTCTGASLSEGSATVRVYRLVSNACNLPNAGACPNASTTSAVYVDRELAATITP
jgi:MSHA biogenesis protein MshP